MRPRLKVALASGQRPSSAQQQEHAHAAISHACHRGDRAQTAQPDIGLLLPCNVIVREEANGGQTVGFMDPVAVMQMTDDPEVAKVAAEVRARPERVRAALTASSTT